MVIQQRRVVMDATRISDGRPVMLKRLLPIEGPYELQINQLFSSEPLVSDPRNHCARLLDVIELPNEHQIMVHPQLRPFNNPSMQTYGEFVAFFSQLCEVSGDPVVWAVVTQLTRGYNSCMKTMSPIGTSPIILHFLLLSYATQLSDCTRANIMLDPSGMYPESFHPVAIKRSKDFRKKAKAYSRTRRPPRYILIDLGLSRQYDPANGPPLENPLRGGDKSAPEHQDRETPCNPFPTDIYYMGNLVRLQFVQVLLSYCIQGTRSLL